MKFGFDIDDTLIGLREHAFRIYSRKLNRQVDMALFRALNKVEIHELFGMTKEQGDRMWRSLREEIYFTDCPPYPGAVETLRMLAAEGHEIYYVTAREKEFGERTMAWLAERGFPVDDGKFHCGMADHEKAGIIRQLNLDFYVDDKPAVLNTLMRMPLRLFVKHQPYNVHLNLRRIREWPQFLEYIRQPL